LVHDEEAFRLNVAPVHGRWGAVSILIGKLFQLAEERVALRRVVTLGAHATRVDELFVAVFEGG
jgi:hypothetical protein